MTTHNATLPFELGSTWLDGRTATGDEAPPVGQEFEVVDTLHSTQRTARYRLVKNNVGAAVFAGTIVQLDANGEQIDGVVAAEYIPENAGAGCALVDDQLPTDGCPNGDWCLVLVKGLGLGKTQIAVTADNVIAAGDQVRATTINAATTASTTVGRIQAVEVSSSVTVAQQELKSILGRAISAAATSGVTATSLLVDWDFPV